MLTTPIEKPFPHWNQIETARLINSLNSEFRSFGLQSTEITDVIQDSILTALEYYQVQAIKPGLIKTIFVQKLKKLKVQSNINVRYSDDVSNKTEFNPDTNNLFSSENLSNIEAEIFRKIHFTPKEKEVFKIWMEVGKRVGVSNPNSEHESIPKTYWDEVKEEVHEKLSIDGPYHSKIKSTIQKKLNENKQLKDGLMMSFITNNSIFTIETRQFLNKIFSLEHKGKNENNENTKNLNMVPENPDLVLVGLNPTKEAVENKAVFSRDNAFWNLLINADLLKSEVLAIDIKSRSIQVFEHQFGCNIKLGFADLLPYTTETDSKKVKVTLGSAEELFKICPNLKSAKRIGLMGQKVVNAFVKDFDHLIKWKVQKFSSEDHFGKMGEIYIDGNWIEIYAMPFPVNNSIRDKHHIYRKLKS